MNTFIVNPDNTQNTFTINNCVYPQCNLCYGTVSYLIFLNGFFVCNDCYGNESQKMWKCKKCGRENFQFDRFCLCGIPNIKQSGFDV